MRLNELTASGALAIAAALAAPAAADDQRDKAETCQLLATAKHLTGDAEKTYVAECVASPTVAANGQSGKQLACEELADSDHLVDAARRSFVSDCVNFH